MSDKHAQYFAKGVLSYPHLKTPDTKFAQGGTGHYGFGLIVDAEEHERLVGVFTPLRDAFIEADDKSELREEWRKKLPFKKETDKDTSKPTGNFIWQFKQNATFTKDNGEVIKFSVTIIDAKTKPISANPWGGSVVKVRFTGKAFGMPSTEVYGVSLRPNTVQVLELVEGGSGSVDGFDEEEGYEGTNEPVAQDEPQGAEESTEACPF